MARLTDTEARQWRNRAIDAERELAALRKRFQKLLDRSFLAIVAQNTKGDGPCFIETIRCDAPHGKVRDANFLDRIQAAIHANIREAGGETIKEAN